MVGKRDVEGLKTPIEDAPVHVARARLYQGGAYGHWHAMDRSRSVVTLCRAEIGQEWERGVRPFSDVGCNECRRKAK